MTWLGDPPEWGWLWLAPLLFALFGLLAVACAVQNAIDQVRR